VGAVLIVLGLLIFGPSQPDPTPTVVERAVILPTLTQTAYHTPTEKPVRLLPSATPEPASVDSPQNPSEGQTLFYDDFSYPFSGWDRTTAEEGGTDYGDDYYRIYVDAENYYIWSNPGLNTQDAIIEVDAYKASGTNDNDFGVLCRYQDNNNFYILTISSDGYYSIGKYLNGEYEFIGMDQMKASGVINQGASTNHIAVRCIGTRLALAVNGAVLAEVEDTSFSSGDVGLIVGTFYIPGTEIHFDNFSVKTP